MPLALIFLVAYPICFAEDYEAWYIPENKIERYPNHPKLKTNADVWQGFTLKEPLFPGTDSEVGG